MVRFFQCYMEDGSFIAFFDILEDTSPPIRDEPEWAQMEQDAVVEMDKWNARKAGAI